MTQLRLIAAISFTTAILISVASKFLDLNSDKDNADFSRAATKQISQMIVKECAQLSIDKSKYSIKVTRESMTSYMSPTLKSLLSEISPSLHESLSSLLIGHVILSQVRNVFTDFQVALSVLLRKRKFVDFLSAFGVCSSYSELLRFRDSAAVAASKNQIKACNITAVEGLVQIIIDNFDLLLSTINNIKQTHALAMIVTQHSSTPLDRTLSESIPKISHQSRSNLDLPEFEVTEYKGQQNVTPLKLSVTVPPLKRLVRLYLEVLNSQKKDFEFFEQAASSPHPIEYSGYNTVESRAIDSKQYASKRLYRPLINMKPASRTTVLSALKSGQDLTKQAGQTDTVTNADL